MLGEGVADLGAGAVAVVGQRLDQNGDAGRAVALVDDPFDRGTVGAGAGADVDRFLDLVLGHRGVSRLLHRRGQRRVAVDVAAAVAGGDGDRPRQLAEELAAFGVGGALLVFDRVPLGMPGHGLPFYGVGRWGRRKSHTSGARLGRRPRLPRDAAGGLLALDGDPAELGLHRLEAFGDPVPERRPLRGRRRRNRPLDPPRRLADRPPQQPLRPHHRHQPAGADPPRLAEKHARHRRR